MIWRLKILAKLILSRLPIPYRFWSSLGAFQHGAMDNADYAITVFEQHLQRGFPDGAPQGFTVLELGPGDSLASALLATAHGAGRIYLVDAGAFARDDLDFYKRFAQDLREKNYTVPDIEDAKSIEDVLNACNAIYLTGGLSDLRDLPENSVDLIYSQAVLEHVRFAEFDHTMAALFRVLKPGAIASHVVDFRDHLSGALHNLRFSHAVWESDFFATSGFYTNRINAQNMMQRFESAGFDDVSLIAENKWDKLPVPKSALHSEFRGVPEAALLTATMTVTMEKPVSQTAKKQV